MAGGKRLTHKAETALAALLTAKTLQEAADRAGISLRTLKRWLRSPAFANAYADSKRQLLERTTARLLSACIKAVETLEDNLGCDNPAARNRAALGILDQAIKAAELRELAEEIAELRRRIGEVKP